VTPLETKDPDLVLEVRAAREAPPDAGSLDARYVGEERTRTSIAPSGACANSRSAWKAAIRLAGYCAFPHSQLNPESAMCLPHPPKPMLTSISTFGFLPTPSIVPRLKACRQIVSMVITAQAPRNHLGPTRSGTGLGVRGCVGWIGLVGGVGWVCGVG
jgi:hypothetical protein